MGRSQMSDRRDIGASAAWFRFRKKRSRDENATKEELEGQIEQLRAKVSEVEEKLDVSNYNLFKVAWLLFDLVSDCRPEARKDPIFRLITHYLNDEGGGKNNMERMNDFERAAEFKGLPAKYYYHGYDRENDWYRRSTPESALPESPAQQLLTFLRKAGIKTNKDKTLDVDWVQNRP